jgi:hypothetical protein
LEPRAIFITLSGFARVDGDVEDGERTFLEKVVRTIVLIYMYIVKPDGGFLMQG